MADDDSELFNSAMEVTDPQAVEPTEPEGQPRDEHGRFAPKAQEQAEPEQPDQDQPAQPTPEPAPEKEAGIPPWRLREEAEARRAAEARAAELERRAFEIEQRFSQFQQKQQPEQVPDIFENPSAFVNQGVRQAIDPIKSEILSIREYYSRREAEREHGKEKVQAAYDALLSARQKNDPEAAAVIQRVAVSPDPFGEIVGWHLKQVVFSQIGADPNAWFEKQLEERLKDPSHQAKLLERIRGQVQQQPQRQITQLPPSLNKTPSAAPVDDSGDDDTDGGLLKSALRR